MGFVPDFVDFPWKSLILWEEWMRGGLGEGWGGRRTGGEERRTVDGI